jgi:hypothetical protein
MNRQVTARIRGVALASGLLLAVAAMARPALADEEADAKALYKEGVLHFEAGRYEEASKAFRAAYEAKPSWKLQYNIGQSEAAARRYGLALDAFEKYLVGGGDDILPKRREEVLAEVQRLRLMVGVVEIKAPDGSELVIDGFSHGVTPFPGPMRVAVGEHVAVIQREGKVLLRQRINVAGGMTTVLEAGEGTEPAAEPAAAPVKGDEAAGETAQPVPVAPPAPAQDEDGGKGKRVWTWVFLGAGAAIVAGGGITGGISMSREKDLKSDCVDKQCPESREGDADSIRAMNLTADILYGVGAAAIVTGIVLAFVEPRVKKKAPTVALVPGDGLVLVAGGRF